MSKLSMPHRAPFCGLGFLSILLSSSMGMARVSYTALPAPEMDRGSSRFLLPEDRKEYIERMVSRMNMTGRKVDPFGRGDVEHRKPDIAHPVPPLPPMQRALAFLKVTTILPREDRFIANGLSYRKGEFIRFRIRGNILKIQVMDVGASRIKFRNPETGEEAVLDLRLLPPGMQRGMPLGIGR